MVRIVDIIPNAPFAARYAAQGATGAFAEVEQKYGLKIKVDEIASPKDGLVAMVNGQYDMSVSSLVPYLQVQAAGKGVKSVFAPFVGGGGVLLGAKKWETDRGADLSKFNGATFGYTREGSASQRYMQLATEKSGLVWKDQPQNAFGDTSAAIPLLQAGRVDIIATDPTTAARAISLGLGYVVLNFNDPATAIPLVGQQLGVVYAFNSSFVDQYPDVAAAVVAALVKGLKAVQAVADDPAKVLALFPKDIQSQLSDGWADAWKLVAPSVVGSDGSSPAAYVTDTVKFAEATGQLKPEEAAVADKVVDNSFVKAANG